MPHRAHADAVQNPILYNQYVQRCRAAKTDELGTCDIPPLRTFRTCIIYAEAYAEALALQRGWPDLADTLYVHRPPLQGFITS